MNLEQTDLKALILRGARVAHRETYNGSFEDFLAEHAAEDSSRVGSFAEDLRESATLLMNDNGRTLWTDLPQDEQVAVAAADAAFDALVHLEYAAKSLKR